MKSRSEASPGIGGRDESFADHAWLHSCERFGDKRRAVFAGHRHSRRWEQQSLLPWVVLSHDIAK